MSVLTEFLLDRVAEDQDFHCEEDQDFHCEWGCHVRIDAEAISKRRMVELVASTDRAEVDADAWLVAKWALRIAALPYADHPDYRPEWRP